MALHGTGGSRLARDRFKSMLSQQGPSSLDQTSQVPLLDRLKLKHGE